MSKTMYDPVARQRALTRRLFLSFGLATLFACGQLAAAELQSTNRPPLRVGVSPVFPPMVFKQGKELVGVEVDLARALGQHLGRKVVFVEVPWKDQIDKLNNNQTDIIMSSMSVTPARMYMMSFSKPYLVVGQLALVRREDAWNYALGFPPSLKGPVGTLKATTGEFLVQRDFPKAKIKTYSNGEAAAKALMKKQINLFISDSTLVWYLAGTHSADGLTAINRPLSEEALAWAVRKSDDKLLEDVNAFVAKASQDGTFLKVFRRWTAIGN